MTIGGESTGEANFFAGGGSGVYQENGEGLKALGNIIGTAPSGADVTPHGIFVFLLCTNNALPVAGAARTCSARTGGVGIEAGFGGAEIKGTSSKKPKSGSSPKSGGSAGFQPDQKKRDRGLDRQRHPHRKHVNPVFGNSIYGSGAAGVRIQGPDRSSTPTKT